MPEPYTLTEQELKSAIIAAWKKHEELAKKDRAPMLYWLRDKLRAQGARNDTADKDRGFGFWVEEHLDFSRRTADRWCDWYAKEAGIEAGLNFWKRQLPSCFLAAIVPCRADLGQGSCWNRVRSMPEMTA